MNLHDLAMEEMTKAETAKTDTLDKVYGGGQEVLLEDIARKAEVSTPCPSVPWNGMLSGTDIARWELASDTMSVAYTDGRGFHRLKPGDKVTVNLGSRGTWIGNVVRNEYPNMLVKGTWAGMSVTEACAAMPNVAEYVEQLEKELAAAKQAVAAAEAEARAEEEDDEDDDCDCEECDEEDDEEDEEDDWDDDEDDWDEDEDEDEDDEEDDEEEMQAVEAALKDVQSNAAAGMLQMDISEDSEKCNAKEWINHDQSEWWSKLHNPDKGQGIVVDKEDDELIKAGKMGEVYVRQCDRMAANAAAYGDMSTANVDSTWKVRMMERMRGRIASTEEIKAFGEANVQVEGGEMKTETK